MNKKLKEDADKLKRDMEKFREDLGSAVSNVGDLSHEKVLEMRENLTNASSAFKGKAMERIMEANEIMRKQGEMALETSRETIARNPLSTVAVSFGAGMLTALLLGRSKNG